MSFNAFLPAVIDKDWHCGNDASAKPDTVVCHLESAKLVNSFVVSSNVPDWPAFVSSFERIDDILTTSSRSSYEKCNTVQSWEIFSFVFLTWLSWSSLLETNLSFPCPQLFSWKRWSFECACFDCSLSSRNSVSCGNISWIRNYFPVAAGVEYSWLSDPFSSVEARIFHWELALQGTHLTYSPWLGAFWLVHDLDIKSGFARNAFHAKNRSWRITLCRIILTRWSCRGKVMWKSGSQIRTL